MTNEQILKIVRQADVAFEALRENEALELLKRALKTEPDQPLLLLRAGILCHQTGLPEEAGRYYRRAIACIPTFGEAYNNLGMLQMETGHLADAVESFRDAARFLPASPLPLTALSTALQRQNLIDEAEAACQAALTLDSSFAEAHHNLAMLLLLRGRFEEGWREYEWRWKVQGFPTPRREFPFPLWDGSPLAGTSILLHAEQGFGDAIQFSRYASLLADSGARVMLACQPELVSLFETLRGVEKVLPFGSSLAAPDFHAPLLSLPRIMKTTLDTLPGSCPYLHAPAGHLFKWRSFVQDDDGFKAGLVWAGRPKPDPGRTCPLRKLTPLGQVPGVSWYSLQIGEGIDEIRWNSEKLPLKDHTHLVADFADTAALASQLDLVITIDSAVAHLAGALGKPVWLLLPFAPDWRWMCDRDDSPWYPTMRIFRQSKPGDWAGTVEKVLAALQLASAQRHA